MPVYTNIHTHIFNVECAPRRFMGIPLPRFVFNRQAVRRVTRWMKRLLPGKRDRLERLANLLIVGTRRNQEEVWHDLLQAYPHMRTRFVVLTLDMDLMEAGTLKNNYETQIEQLYRVKRSYPEQLLPFISIDPRKQYPGGVYGYLEKQMPRFGFVGLKIYPALGFYPFAPGLEDAYRFAVERKLPVMVHCNKTGIWFQGEIRNEHLYPESFNKSVPRHDYSAQKDLKNKVFKNNFSDPSNYGEVLEIFPDLKLCFSHYGGASEMLKAGPGGSSSEKDNFYLKIREMIKKHENVYADIAYTLGDIDDIGDILLKDLEDEKIRERLLFGTDFFLALQERSERGLLDHLLKIIPADFYYQIAVTNPDNFLHSKYYPKT